MSTSTPDRQNTLGRNIKALLKGCLQNISPYVSRGLPVERGSAPPVQTMFPPINPASCRKPGRTTLILGLYFYNTPPLEGTQLQLIPGCFFSMRAGSVDMRISNSLFSLVNIIFLFISEKLRATISFSSPSSLKYK